MEADFLEQLLVRTGAFTKKATTFTVKDGAEVTVTAASDGYEVAMPRVREIVVDKALTIVTTAADGSTTTYLETASVVSVTVRGGGSSPEKKRTTGFA